MNFLFKEIDALKRLEHPNIIKLYASCMMSDNTLALVLEYSKGGSLKGKINHIIN
jgi:serine/threonine protein kinase